MTTETNTTISIPIARLAEIAILSWKLESWLRRRSEDDSLTAVRYVSRKIAQFLSENGFSTMDLHGQIFDAGLALDVLETVELDTLASDTIVTEMLSPIVCHKDVVVRNGEVVVGVPKNQEGG